jgi:hypothetical protein
MVISHFFITVSVIKFDDVSYGFSISDRAILLRSVKCFGLFRMDEARVRKRLLLLLYVIRERGAELVAVIINFADLITGSSSETRDTCVFL